MRSARLTYPSAWHHIMNRGYESRPIFPDESSNHDFLRLLFLSSKKYGIRLIGYCLMTNHYHLLLQNRSGKLSEFMKYLDSIWAERYRKKMGGMGFVFQGRFKSTLIEEEDYLETALCYILLNPVRAGLTNNPWEHPHSSIHHYFTNTGLGIDSKFVRTIFPTRKHLLHRLEEWEDKSFQPLPSRIGPILGSSKFAREALRKYNKRKTSDPSPSRRIDETDFQTENEIILQFEKDNRIRVKNINTSTLSGKRLRAILLVALKDKAGLTYSEISSIPFFHSLKHSSLAQLYMRAKLPASSTR